ncbi:hypothetical protein COV61_02235 [Candidatus Micrarchaeota archaeon CG11_big_fil_rev_8_21_14_0_20_47_5]|nr:MAG: hypothetical protein COV61_02235 [Candidatus Micrarchaeota archaeon CG11_big_fil_rev_8_21_14_0_20_47_5]
MKGQAAMEYLMTYGWAVLVIVIVIAALFSFTSFFKVGEQCLFSQKTFSCSDPSPQVLSPDGKIIFTLKNLGQKGVTIHSLACITEDSEVPTAFTTIPGGELIPTGSAQTFSDVDYKCKRNGGALELTAGSEFRGKLIVKYNYENEPAEYSQRQADASLTATVVAAGTGTSGNGECPGGVCAP